LEPTRPSSAPAPGSTTRTFTNGPSFLAGSVINKDTDECAEGVKATVSAAGTAVAEATTNNYGDFVIDRLTPQATYTLTLEASGANPRVVRSPWRPASTWARSTWRTSCQDRLAMESRTSCVCTNGRGWRV